MVSAHKGKQPIKPRPRKRNRRRNRDNDDIDDDGDASQDGSPIDSAIDSDDVGSDASSSGSSSSAAPSLINVDFDFVSPQPIDFHAIRRLLQQLFYTHHASLDLSSVADAVIRLADASVAEGSSSLRGGLPALGTAVKVDGDPDGDPFAFISAIPLGLTPHGGAQLSGGHAQAAASMTTSKTRANTDPSSGQPTGASPTTPPLPRAVADDEEAEVLHKARATLTSYFVQRLAKASGGGGRAGGGPTQNAALRELVCPTHDEGAGGGGGGGGGAAGGVSVATLVLHERMVNLPAQIAPPLYRMLLQELEQRRKARPSEPAPTHLLFYSRVFSSAAFSDDEEEESQGDDENDDDGDDDAEGRPQGFRARLKKRRKNNAGRASAATTSRAGGAAGGKGVGTAEQKLWPFRPEDDIIAKYATHTFTHRFAAPPSAAESFEAPLFGRLMAVPSARCEALVAEMEASLGGAGAQVGGQED